MLQILHYQYKNKHQSCHKRCIINISDQSRDLLTHFQGTPGLCLGGGKEFLSKQRIFQSADCLMLRGLELRNGLTDAPWLRLDSLPALPVSPCFSWSTICSILYAHIFHYFVEAHSITNQVRLSPVPFSSAAPKRTAFSEVPS